MHKKIFVADHIDNAGFIVLKNRGFEVDAKYDLTEEELIDIIPQYDGLIVRSRTQVTRGIIEAGKDRLKIIGRAGVSVDNIDLNAATDAGIIVCNAPGSNIVSAAEYAMALILSAARNIPQANNSMHAGKWDNTEFMGFELYEKTLAIFGLGRVGSLVAARAQSFGMRLLAFDPYCSKERAASLGVELIEDIDDILPLADFITVHMPRTRETVKMLGAEEFSRMKDNVILVNVSHNGVFDEKAMSDFIAAGKIHAVGLDVFEKEPCHDSPLHEFSQALLTPHIGALTVEAQRRAGVQIATFVAQGLSGSIVPTAVNISHVPQEILDKVGSYLTATQMLGRILSQLEDDIPQELHLTLSGSLANADLSLFLASALKGLMAYKQIGSITSSNAEAVAQRHGIKTLLSSQITAQGYDSSIELATPAGSISATLYGNDRPARIISLFGYCFDVELTAHSLIIQYVDAPGRIGMIGSILGEAGINIQTMQIGLKNDSNKAISFLNIDREAGEDVINKLKAEIEDLDNLWYIQL